SLQFGQVPERVHTVEFACMNQAHEQIAHHGSVRSLVEQCVLTVQNGFLQGAFAKIVIEWHPFSRRNSVSGCQWFSRYEIALPSPELGSVFASASCPLSQPCN